MMESSTLEMRFHLPRHGMYHFAKEAPILESS